MLPVVGAPGDQGDADRSHGKGRSKDQYEPPGGEAPVTRRILQHALADGWRDGDRTQCGAQDDVVAPHPGGGGPAARTSGEVLLERSLLRSAEPLVDPLRGEQEVGLVVVHLDGSPPGDRISRSRIRALQM